MSYIPENRLGVGLAPGVSVLDNSAIREYFKASYGPHLSKGKMLNYLKKSITHKSYVIRSHYNLRKCEFCLWGDIIDDCS